MSVEGEEVMNDGSVVKTDDGDITVSTYGSSQVSLFVVEDFGCFSVTMSVEQANQLSKELQSAVEHASKGELAQVAIAEN